MRRLTKTGAAHVTNCSFDQTIAVNVIFLSFACLFLFPASTQYPAGSPNIGGGVLGVSGQQKTTQKCVVLRKPWLLCILITIYIFHNATIFTALHTHCTTQASVNSRRTPPRVINCAFDQTIVASNNYLSFACLFLFPKSTSIFWGPRI